MKETFRTFLTVAACCSIAMYCFFLVSDRQEAGRRVQYERASFGAKDDPQARVKYEWMMLRDPKSGEIPKGIRSKELAFSKNLPSREAIVRLGKGSGVQALGWSYRGPYNVGGRTRALALDATNESIILAGGISGGMWRSTNGGASWTRTTSLNLNTQSVTSIAQDTRVGNTSTWYYGTGERRGNTASSVGGAYLGDGIFKSTDGGQSWVVLASTVSGTPQTWDGDFDYVWNIVIDPSNATQEEVYAAVYGGIKRSTNGGSTTWSNALTADASLLSGNFTDVAITSTGVVYATISSDGSSQSGIFRSVDGTSWIEITPSNFPTTFNRIVIGVAPSNQNIVYFLAETPGSGVKNHSLWKYTFVSGDGSGTGGTWENRSSNIPAYGPPVGDFDSQASYDLVIKVKPDNPNVVFIGGTNLYRSTDGFATTGNTSWVGGYAPANDVSQVPNQHADQHAMTFLPSNSSVLFAGHDGGISKTSDCLASSISWSTLNNGYSTTQFYTVALDHGSSGSAEVIGGMQDNGTWLTNSTSGTSTWIEMPGGGDGAYRAIADGATSYYSSSQNGSIYRFVPDGTFQTGQWQWTSVTPTGASGFLFVAPFALDPNDNRRMFLAAGSTVWRNSNLTAIPLSSNDKTSVNWDSLTVSYVSDAIVSAVAVSKTPTGRLYYGTSKGKVFRIDNAHLGSPSARTDITSISFPTDAYVSCVAVDPTDADNVLVAFSNYNVQSLFSSTNGGTSWTAVGGNLEQNSDGTGNGPSIRWATILPLGSAVMYLVGTSVGVHSTTSLNGSSTVWAQEGAGSIGKVVVPMIVSRPADGLVVAATHANGIYTATLAATPTVPAAPTLATPTDGAAGVSTNPALSWNSVVGATSYTLQVSTGADFATLAVGQSGITSTSFPVSGLQNSTQYFWRVSATNAAGTSPFSATRSFTTVVAAPAAPTLASPADGATGVSASPTLVWDAVSAAASYTVQLSTTSAFTSLFVNQSGITATSFPVTGLSSSTQYFWRVSATNAGGTSPFATRSFTTAPVSSVELIDRSIPRDFDLAQNYPNPFNPSTMIEFSVPNESRIRIRIIDASGKDVATLVDGVRAAGKYAVRWDNRGGKGTPVGSGVYFYRMESSLYSKTRKMVVVR